MFINKKAIQTRKNRDGIQCSTRLANGYTVSMLSTILIVELKCGKTHAVNNQHSARRQPITEQARKSQELQWTAVKMPPCIDKLKHTRTTLEQLEDTCDQRSVNVRQKETKTHLDLSPFHDGSVKSLSGFLGICAGLESHKPKTLKQRAEKKRIPMTFRFYQKNTHR